MDLGDVDSSFEDDDDDELIFTFLCLVCNEYARIESLNPRLCRTSLLRGHDYVLELLNGHESRCYDCFRMNKNVFIAFCEELKSKTNLRNSRFVTVQEQVTIFLLTI